MLHRMRKNRYQLNQLQKYNLSQSQYSSGCLANYRSMGSKERGSIWVTILLIVCIAGWVMVFIKSAPSYFDMKVLTQVFSRIDDERVPIDGGKKKIASLIIKRLEVNNIKYVKKDQIEIKLDKKSAPPRFIVKYKYEVRIPLVPYTDMLVWRNYTANVDTF